MAVQPGRCEAGEAQSERAATAGAERGRTSLAQQRGAERIRHHEATFVGDQHLGKVVGNREIETICEIAVRYPLVIGTEVGDRAFDLDDHKIPRLAEAEKIRAGSVDQWKLDEDGIAELAER